MSLTLETLPSLVILSEGRRGDWSRKTCGCFSLSPLVPQSLVPKIFPPNLADYFRHLGTMEISWWSWGFALFRQGGAGQREEMTSKRLKSPVSY